MEKTVFLFVVVMISCQLEMEADVSSVEDIMADTTEDSDTAGVDVAEDTTSADACESVIGYWHCSCQSGPCWELWKDIVDAPCDQGACAIVTDTTAVDSAVYQISCVDVGTVEDGVLSFSTGEGSAKTTYQCIPAGSP